MTTCDDRGRTFGEGEPPRRIVSLVPSVSETLCALGVGGRLVGVTRYCTDPPELSSVPRCGGTKNPDHDAIAALRPDLVFMSEEENRVEDFDQLERAGFRVFVCMPKSVDDIADWARRVGAAVGCAAEGERLAVEIEAATVLTRDRVSARGERRRVLCPIWKKPWMTFNADTYAHALLETCGGDNVYAEATERYFDITLEDAGRRRPDLVLLPDEPYPFAARHVADFASLMRPQGTAAAARVMDGQALTWYGVRTAEGLRIVEQAIFGGQE